MQSDIERSDEGRAAARLILCRDLAFASMFAALTATVVAVSLDLAYVVPLLAGKNVYNPIRFFVSYQVDTQSGQIMTGAFLLLAVAAWSYAGAAYLAPGRRSHWVVFIATLLFGSGLFVGACFRAVPAAEGEVDRWLRSLTRLHDIGIGGGFIPAMLGAFFDQYRIVLGRVPGYRLMKLSFGFIVAGGLGTVLALVLHIPVAGLMQRVFILGIVLWLVTEAHQLFWRSVESDAEDRS
jgi:hypothetical protein